MTARPIIITLAGATDFTVRCTPAQQVVAEWLAAARWDADQQTWLVAAGGRRRLVADLEVLGYRVRVIDQYGRIIHHTPSRPARRHARRVAAEQVLRSVRNDRRMGGASI